MEAAAAVAEFEMKWLRNVFDFHEYEAYSMDERYPIDGYRVKKNCCLGVIRICVVFNGYSFGQVIGQERKGTYHTLSRQK